MTTPNNLVDRMIASQREKGLATYGVPLCPWTTPPSTEHALAEAVDLAHYIAQWQLEREEMLRLLHALWLCRYAELVEDQQATVWRCLHAFAVNQGWELGDEA